MTVSGTDATAYRAGGARLRMLWLVLLLAALFCRGAVADGFMPDSGPGHAPRIAICHGGMAAAQMDIIRRDGKTPVPKDGRRHAPCPYMALASFTPVEPVLFVPPVIPATPFDDAAPAAVTPPRYKTSASPRGPPSFS